MNQPPTMPVIFIDVDDTLVRSAGGTRIPMTPVVERVRELHSRGFELYCWSSAGTDYARTSVEELGIAACFVGFLPKPDVLIDDQHPNDWRQLRWLHPNEAASRGPDDYLAERER